LRSVDPGCSSPLVETHAGRLCVSGKAISEPFAVAAELGRIFRFGIVGVANTAVGCIIIYVLESGCGLDPLLANAGCFAVGIGLSFLFNRGFVFKTRSNSVRTFGRYGAAVVLAFGLNQLTLAALTRGWFVVAHPFLAQGIAFAVYSTTCFILFRLWVFPRPDRRQIH
jgi:putative flippase GtrA